MVAAIHAMKSIATENILPRQFNFFKRHSKVCTQADYAGICIGFANGSNNKRSAVLNHFGFCKEQEKECFFCAANADWFVTLIENKNLGIERRWHFRRWAGIINAKMSNVTTEGKYSLQHKHNSSNGIFA